ncbi:MAG: hypothetical protein HY331_01215 [Chloroflexi bacterium]|nr:hypothetical protein [Chloroflexota bacterium]
MSNLAPGTPWAGNTALHPPAAGWDGPMSRDKKLWTLAMWVSSLLLIAITFAWFFIGKQNTPPAHYAVTPEAFQAQVEQFVKKYETAPGSGEVRVPPGQDAYLLSRIWSFYPVLRLKKGQTYTVWYSSTDLVHNPIIAGQRFSFTAIPGHAYGIRFTPMEEGTFLLYCAEYCGVGHQVMASKLIVEP